MTGMKLSRIIRCMPAMDGAGVKLKRSVGAQPRFVG